MSIFKVFLPVVSLIFSTNSYADNINLDYVIYNHHNVNISILYSEYEDNQNTCPPDIDCDDPSWFYKGGKPDCCIT